MRGGAAGAGVPALLSELRKATAAQHEALERLLALDQALSRSRYIRVMQGFDAFLAAWEPAVAAAVPPAWRSWFQDGLRGALAAQDVRALGAARLKPAQLEIALVDDAAVLGTLYVLEGSALGAQVIAPALGRHLGITRESGAAYFHQGSETAGARWREFRALLAAPGASAPSACRAARQTFDALAAVFAGALEGP